MAWNSSTAHYSGEVADMPAVLNGLALDDRTWGGAVDAGSNGLANLGYFRLNPITLPTSPSTGMIVTDSADGVTKQWTGTAWRVFASGYTPVFIFGSGAPSSGTGNNGDLYIDYATWNVYGPKASNAWGGTVGCIQGPKGDRGDKGDTGSNASALSFQGPYVAGSTYSQGQGVTYSNSLYGSLVNANTGNQPDISPTKWVNLGTAAAWGSISGTLSAQTDLVTALAAKAPATSGTGVLKGDGSGGTAAAVAGTDYQAPLPWIKDGSGDVHTTGKVGIGAAPVTYPLEITGPVGSDLITKFFSASGQGAYLDFGPSATPAEVSGDSSGNLNFSHYGVAASVLQSVRAGAIASTLVLNGGYIVLRIPNAAPSDAVLANSNLVIWYDQTNNRIVFRVRSSTGGLKTGYVTVS